MDNQLQHCPHCPTCKGRLDGFIAAAKHGHTPAPSDLTLCLHCTELLEFDAKLELIVIRQETRDRIHDGELEQLIQTGVQLRQMIIAERRRKMHIVKDHPHAQK